MGSRKRAITWSDLPRELLESIADRLGNGLDVTRFRSVCESWRFSATPFIDPISFPIKVPSLGSWSRGPAFLALSQATIYHLSDPSSSSSWLVKLREQKGQRQTHVLVNPLSALPISPLPESFPRTIDSSRFRVSVLVRAYSIQLSNGNFSRHKVALSLTRRRDCPFFVFMVAYGVLLELKLNEGEPQWKPIDDVSSQLLYQDVVLYGDRFCAVDGDGRTVEVDPSSSKASVIACQISGSCGGKKSLVVSDKDLLLVDKNPILVDAYVQRRVQGQGDEIFRVYRLNEDKKRWDEVRSLEDRVVFLGDDCTFSVPAGDLGDGFEGNCIIYRDHGGLGDGFEGHCLIFRDPHFMVFTLRDRRVSSLAQRPEYAQLFHPPPATP